MVTQIRSELKSTETSEFAVNLSVICWSSAMFARGHGQASDVIIEPALVKWSTAIVPCHPHAYGAAGISVISSCACHVTLHPEFVRGYATFDTLLIIWLYGIHNCQIIQ